jgi:hypothetical protein
MNNSQYWINHFRANATEKRVNWDIAPNITEEETAAILHRYKPGNWAKHPKGKHLIAASTKYAMKVGDATVFSGRAPVYQRRAKARQ